VGKLFLTLQGEPLLTHALRALQASPLIGWIVPVARPEDFSAVQALVKRHRITKAVAPCVGGASRSDSVARGVAAAPPKATWILVHDGARPCVSANTIRDAVEQARRHGAVACGLPASLTVKAVDERKTVRLTLDRGALWFVQTPQVFRRDWFSDALGRATGALETFPDDAAVVESAGYTVRMIPGDPLNIKVTTREDLLLAETILISRARVSKSKGSSHKPKARAKSRKKTR
jgi:2-C-methyl-D-erythritol 4-phosphate cytidylyltransferase